MLSSVDRNNSNLYESAACVATFCAVMRYCLLMSKVKLAKILLRAPHIFLSKGTATRNSKILHVFFLRHTVKVMNFSDDAQFVNI